LGVRQKDLPQLLERLIIQAIPKNNKDQ
jgi:hypothetical protein